MKTTLHIKDLSLHVHLGWTDKERAEQQTVWLDLFIEYPTAPKACLTDDLADTVCYDQLISSLATTVKSTPFRLIERLADAIYQHTKSLLPEQSKIKVAITKYPHLEHLNKGVAFHYGD